MIYILPNTIHQHFNADPERPARLVSATNRIYKWSGLNDLEQIENAPTCRSPAQPSSTPKSSRNTSKEQEHVMGLNRNGHRPHALRHPATPAQEGRR